MTLPKRLLAIALMVKNDKKVIDIGCDHALLDIYLTHINPEICCIASDKSMAVYQKTKKIIAEKDLSNRIMVVHSDGLKNITITPSDTLVLAGMGTKTILKILTSKVTNRMVIASHNDLYLLRKEITEKQFLIYEEQIVLEKGIYYVIIDFRRGKASYDRLDLEYGPILRYKRDTISMAYFNNMVEQNRKVIDALPIDHPNRESLVSKNSWIEHEILNKF